MFGFTSAMIRPADSAAARVTSTDTPRLQIPSSSGGAPARTPRHIEREHASAQHLRDGSQRHGYVIEAASPGQVTHIGADVPRTMSETDRPFRRTGAIGPEMDELDPMRSLRIALERREEDPRRRACGTDEDACAGADAGDGLLG